MQLCNSSWSYRSERCPPKICNTYVRCLVGVKRQDVQQGRNGLYLTSQVTHSVATGMTSRARLRTQLIEAVSHEPGYAIRCYRQYLMSQVTHSATTGSSTGRMLFVCRRSPARISVVTTILVESYCGLSQSLQTNTKMAHKKSGHDHFHILSKSLLTIVLSHSATQSDLLPASLSNLGAVTGNTTSC
jgi:hypothetical protein